MEKLSNKTIGSIAIAVLVIIALVFTFAGPVESATDSRPPVVLDAEGDILRNQLTKEENRNCYKAYAAAEKDNEDQLGRLQRNGYSFDWNMSKAVKLEAASSSASSAPLE
jgi:hypothetical protein